MEQLGGIVGVASSAGRDSREHYDLEHTRSIAVG